MTLPLCLAQANTSDATTIQIDPDTVEGIEIVSDAAEATEPEVQGAVSEALEDALPETGIDSVDGAVNTLTEAIKKALDDAGIEIPYPYRTLTFSKNESDIINAVAGRADGGASSEDDGKA